MSAYMMKHYFVPAQGINAEFITTYIRYYLGCGALVQRGSHENPGTGQIQNGYFIKAYKCLTAEITADMKTHSKQWEAGTWTEPLWYWESLLCSMWSQNPTEPVQKSVTNTEAPFWSVPGIQLYEQSKKHKDQLEFLKILWGLLDTIIELMQAVRIYITLILDTVSSSFSEFPNSMRPPCTTMPWTIWPALVVLWGVCWMFENRPNTFDELQLQLSLQDVESTLFSSSDALLNPFGTPFWADQGISNSLPSEDLNSLSNSIGWLNDIEFNQISPLKEGNRVLETFSERLSTSLTRDQNFSSNYGSSIDFFRDPTSVAHYPITASAGENSNVPLHGESSVVGFTIGGNTQARQSAPSPQVSTTSAQLQKPPQNFNGEMICDHLDCSNKNLIFTNNREWSKHKNKHERPYKCTIQPCTRTQGFASKGDQERHERTVHKAHHSGADTQGSTSTRTLHFCDEPNCDRGPGHENAGFTRRDNLMDHVRRRHGRVLASSRASVRREEGSNGVTMVDNQRFTGPLPEEQQMGLGVAVPGKQKRTVSQASGTFEEETSAWKKPRQENQGPNVDTERTSREEALTQEVEKLKKELENSQKEKEVLIGIIDRLTQGPK